MNVIIGVDIKYIEWNSFILGNCNGIEDKISLLCHECKDSFESAWDLIVHVQAAHMMNVYELGVPKLKSDQQLSPHPTEHILMENGVRFVLFVLEFI